MPIYIAYWKCPDKKGKGQYLKAEDTIGIYIFIALQENIVLHDINE